MMGQDSVCLHLLPGAGGGGRVGVGDLGSKLPVPSWEPDS